MAQIRHHETDFIPYTLGWEGDVAERLDAHYGSAAWRDLLDSAIRHVPGPNLVVDTNAGPLFTDVYGSVWRVDRRPWHLEQPALKEPSLQGYAFPEVGPLLCRPTGRRAALQAWEALRDHFTVAGFGFGLFERTWTLRGFTDVLTDAAAEPEFYDELVERIAEHQLADHRPAAGAARGRDHVQRRLGLPAGACCWAPTAGGASSSRGWRACTSACIARASSTLSHCCGSVVDIVPDLIEIGLDVLESVQPEAMNPYRAEGRMGENITFWGGLGSQSVIPFGTPQEIRAEVAHLCREMGRGGGYILAPAKALQPETPTANAAAVVEAFLGQAA